MKIVSTIILFFTVCISTFSQHCADPSYAQSFSSIPSTEYENAYIESKNYRTSELRMPYEIPIILHLVHAPGTVPGSGSVPSVSEISAGIDILNSVFAGETSCGISNPGPDMNISFCPAQRTLSSIPTSSVLPYESSYASLDMCTEEKQMKEEIHRRHPGFSTTDYLNIFLVEDICASCSPYGCDVRGFASYSTAHGTPYDGIVIEYQAWPGIDPDCHRAKTLYHEIGHYFNLYHTFYGACKNDDCLRDGDKVCDTPPDRATNISQNNPCTTGEPYNSCATDSDAPNPQNPYTTDVPDLQENFMDYAPPACLQSFTQGQKERMHATLENERSSLLQSRGCQPGCDPYIPLSIANPPEDVPLMSSINLVNTSDPTYAYHWILPDGSIDTNYDLNWTPDALGYQKIGLTSLEMPADCRDTLWLSFEVMCPLSGSIQGPQGKVKPGQTYQWSVVPQTDITYRWYLDEEYLGEGETIQFPIEFRGNAGLRLEACNSECCASVDIAWLRTTDCPSGREADYWIFNDTQNSILGHPLSIRFTENSIVYDTLEETNYGTRPYDNYEGYEGCLTVNDAEGNLLFYSDGSMLFNRKHENLASFRSNSGIYQAARTTSQMAYCKKPGSDSLYYIFTTEEVRYIQSEDENSYLRAAVVDMSRDNGYGMLIEDDIQIFKPSSEKIQVVPHCNGSDYWLVTTEGFTNKIVSFLVDTNGIQLSPIKSDILAPFFNVQNEQSELNIFPDGFTINSIRGTINRVPPFEVDQYMEFGHFNNSNGSYRPIDTLYVKKYNFLSFSAYSSTRSPDDRYAYFEMGLHTLILDIEALLYKNKMKIDTFVEQNGRATDFSRTPQGEIMYIYYQSGDDVHPRRIRRILYPNRPFPASMFQDTAETKKMDIGDFTLQFPQYSHDVYAPGKPFIQGMRMYCDTLDQVSYTVKNTCATIEYQWQVRGSADIVFSSEDSVVLQGNGGIDTLIYLQETACGENSDTMIITEAVCTETCNNQFDWVEPDTVLCETEDQVFLKFSSNAVFEYLYTDAEKSPLKVSNGIISGPAPPERQVFWLHLETEMGCDTLIEFYISRDTSLDLAVIRKNTAVDTAVCRGNDAELSLPQTSGSVYLENTATGQRKELLDTFHILDNILADSCYRLSFYGRDSVCSFDTSFCVTALEAEIYSQGEEVLCAGDTLSWRESSLTSEGIYRDTISCDSIFEVALSFLDPIPETILRDTSCMYQTEEVDSVLLQSINGCDSLVVSYHSPLPPDTIQENLITCDSSLLGIDTLYRNHEMDCDSVIFRNYSYGDVITESMTRDTCVQPGTTIENDTLYLLSDAGCDSLVSISYTLRFPDTTWQTEVSCFPQPSDTSYLSGQHGCDSLVITEYFHQAADTTFRTSESCNAQPNDTIIFQNRAGCDSLVITEYTRLGTDTTSLDSLVCTPRSSEKILLENRAGCDSVILITYQSSGHFVNVPAVVEVNRGDTLSIPVDLNFDPESVQWNATDGILNPESLTDTIRFVGIETFLYRLELTDRNGCVYSKAIQVLVNEPERNIYIPNAFSPNGDGINDHFKVYTGEEVPTYQKMEIFDRWGARIYSAAGTEVIWDGRSGQNAVSPGVYIYSITLQYSNEVKKFSGNVTVVK